MLAGMLPHILFWFPVVTFGLLSAQFLRRRIYSELPFFFLYAWTSFFFGISRYIAFKTSTTSFFYVYWISELAGAVIFALAMYEVFLRRLFPRFYKLKFYRRLFPATALLILLGTIGAVLQSHDRSAAFQVASRVFDFARTACLVFFMLLMSFMGRQWTRYDFGITLGFGVQAAAALANAAVRARLGHRSPAFDTIETVAFEFACIIWLATFIKAPKPDRIAPAVPLDPQLVHDARKWESVLKHWITPGK
jgi:glycerol uptake facilitator-like aquaporin